jgi:aminomethyltransferase
VDGAVADRSARAFVGVRGRDAAKLLQSLVTSDVDALGVGDAQLAFVLTPKGRPIADLRIWREGDEAFVVEAEPELQDQVAAVIRRYRLAAKADVVDDRERLALLAVAGPVPAADGVLVAPGLLGSDVLGPRDAIAGLRETLLAGGAREVGPDAYELLRIEAGVPRTGREIDEGVLPAETGLVDRAVSFTKGCYVGQEPVARLHYRGHANRRLSRLRLVEGELPGLPAEIAVGDRVVGRLTSAAVRGAGDAIGLGYVRREVADGTIVELRDGTGAAARARVEDLAPASMGA